jgi:excisionase family DNA binding protein
MTVEVNPSASLPLRAVYTVPELAKYAGVSRFFLLRLLRSNDVPFVRSGRMVLVPLCDIELRMPRLWRSIVAAERVRADARAERV